MKDLVRVSDLDPGGLRQILRAAACAKRQPRRTRHLLADERVVLSFAEPSIATQVCFEVAVGHLGGGAVGVGPLDREVEDTAAVISEYAKAVVLRTSHQSEVERFAAAATIPVVNAGTDLHDPCPAVADLLTVQERFGHLTGLRIAYLGAGDGAANSLVEACALTGVDIVVASPLGAEPDAGITDDAAAVATVHGSLVLTTHDPLAAAAGADVVVAGVWPAGADREAFGPYRVDLAVMAVAAPAAVFLHGLPAHRGDEVTASVIDGPQSLVVEQAANRLHAAQGILVSLLEHRAPVVARPAKAGTAVR